MLRLTQLTGCARPALGTPALATHRVTGGLAVAQAALQAAGSVPPRRTRCEERQGKPSMRKSRRRTVVKHHLSHLTALLALEDAVRGTTSRNGDMTDKELLQPMYNWSGNKVGDEVN